MPEYLQKYNTNNGIGAFVIEINITAVHKHYAFPLIILGFISLKTCFKTPLTTSGE